MSLTAGSRIGPYEVAAQIGAGGMGEVYQATDTRLKRQVAIKVLPDALAADPERLARFQREAEVLASFNHQNIAQLLGLEESDGVKALVMELVEGPTLADRIAQGALPVEDALAIAKQIVAALEAAHEQGVTHRDLKPANVKVRPDGTVKVLDFRLAKLAESAPGSNIAATMSPTLSLNATMAGVILGTAAYMAPEQARGRAVDKRADIWAFGAVLFEMVTASQPFPGEDVSHVLARVIDRDPDWSLLPSSLPPAVRTCLQRCLVKDPRQRVRDIGDVRLALEGAFETQSTQSGDLVRIDGSPVALWRRPLPTAGLSVVLAGLVGAAVWFLMRPEPPAVTRFVLNTPPDGALSVTTRVAIAIAPDGTMAYASTGSLYLRRPGDVDAVAIRGSEGRALASPFFSPDGTSVGFAQGPLPPYLLKRVPAAGGAATTIAQLSSLPWGASWGEGNTIVFGSDEGLQRVSANGGTPEPLTRVSAKGESHRWPFVLPNGRGALFAIWSGSIETTRIAVVSFETGAVSSLGLNGTSPTYTPDGCIVYAATTSLRAVRFDIDRLRVTSDEPVTVLESVYMSTTGGSYFRLADNGTLAYYVSPPATRRVTLALVDTAGQARPLGMPGSGYQYPRVSPDGRRVAYQADYADGPDVVTFEIGSNTAPLRLTFGGKGQYPVWTADGRRIIFQSNRDGDGGLFWQASDGTEVAERLTTPGKGESHIPDSVSRDGAWLTFTVERGQASEIWRLSLRTRKAEPLITEPNQRVNQSVLSPDGRWIAYQSGVSMRGGDIFIEPFPPTGAKYQVPPAEANHHPIWAPDGRALYYVPGARQFARVPISTAPRFVFGTPEMFELNRDARTGGPTQLRRLDLLPDGKQFVGVWPEDFGKQSSQDTERRIVVIQNWDQELKRLMSR